MSFYYKIIVKSLSFRDYLYISVQCTKYAIKGKLDSSLFMVGFK